MESPTVPRHLVASEGRIYAKSQNGAKNYTPKTIDYRHTIRIISPFLCSHQEEIERMNTLLAEKQRQIEILRLVLTEKDKGLQSKDEEILRLKQSIRDGCQTNLKISILDNKLQRSEVTEIFNSCVKSHSDHQFQNIKSSFILESASYEGQQRKDVNYMEQELSNMEHNLKQLANALNKPKRPYQFYTRPKEYVPSLPTKIQRFQTNTQAKKVQFVGEDDSNQEDEAASVECTSTNQSFDATDFLEQAINEHKVLRDALIELQRTTKAEMKQMKSFYENEIEGYKRMLQRQRDKTNQIDALKIHDYQKSYHRILQQQFSYILSQSINNPSCVPLLQDDD